MDAIKDSPYLFFLLNAYRDEYIDASPSEKFRSWVRNKRTHSIEVARAGIGIMAEEPVLAGLDDEARAQFLGALLLHDVARVKNLDFDTGETLEMDHGVEGARDVLGLGESSPRIVIPVMAHNQIDEAFIDLSESELEQAEGFRRLGESDKAFVLEWNRVFRALPEEEKRIARLGVDLVKDADKLANLLVNDERKLIFTPRKPEIAPEIFGDIMAGRLARKEFIKTFADEVLAWLSWIYDFRFAATRRIFLENDVLERYRDLVLRNLPGASESDIAAVEGKLETAIGRLRKK